MTRGPQRRRGAAAVATALLLLVGCGGAPPRAPATVRAVEVPIAEVAPPSEPAPSVQDEEPSLGRRLADAERVASPAGRTVLATARGMIDAGVVVRGSCWDFAHAVFARAGFPLGRKTRRSVFSGPKKGPYADARLIEPGDWLYYVNHSYGEVPHSAIFVDWEDAAAREGLMITYVGQRRRQPGRYEIYDLSSVYRIIRPVDVSVPGVSVSVAGR